MGGVPWTKEEDSLLKKCILQYGEGNWHRLPLLSGLKRCRKSCRLRWLNYLRPNIKRGSFTHDEVQLILKLHKMVGNRWTIIAGRLPGRTANDVKNYWNCHLSKKLLNNSNNAEDAGNSKMMMMMMIRSRHDNEHEQEEQVALNINEAEGDHRPVDSSSGINCTSSSYVDHQYHQLQHPLVEDLPLPFMDFEFQPLKPTNQCDNWDDFILDLDLI